MAATDVLQGINNHLCALQLGGSLTYVSFSSYSRYAHDQTSNLNKVLYGSVQHMMQRVRSVHTEGILFGLLYPWRLCFLVPFTKGGGASLVLLIPA